VVTQRARNRWLSALRKPNALRATSLITRLIPSFLALPCPVSMNAAISAHPRSTADFRDVGVRAPGEELAAALPTWRRSAPVRAVGLAAPPAALVPAELQSVIAVKEIARPGHRRAFHLAGENPAGRAGPGLSSAVTR
jgi:hypothetical protein